MRIESTALALALLVAPPALAAPPAAATPAATPKPGAAPPTAAASKSAGAAHAPAPSAAPSAAAGLPPDSHVLWLPNGAQVDWVLPHRTTRAASTPSGGGAADRLLVDDEGLPWIAASGLLLHLEKGGVVSADRPLDDLVWIDDGRILAASKGELGFVTRSKGPKASLAFQPKTKIPAGELRLFSARGPFAYLRIRRPTDDQLFLYDAAAGRIKPLVQSRKRITAVTGDGNRTFAAIDGTVHEIRAPKAIPEPGESDTPTSTKYAKGLLEVTGLELVPGVGLFYTTPIRVGFLGRGWQSDMLLTRRPEIAARGDALFVRFGPGGGIARIRGTEAGLRAAAPKKKGKP